MSNKILKKGYTTGVHTSFAFKSALYTFFVTKSLTYSKTTKMQNDDLDVTQGCEIVVTISKKKDDLQLNPTKHKPYILKNSNFILNLYAGVGVGVATKDGLKVLKNYPAINPIPLKALIDIFNNFVFDGLNLTVYCTVSVKNGENIAKQTANQKVGVVGGISILGTTGWVKPVSSSAYIDSINEELNFAKANGYDSVIFTLGNKAYQKAQDIKGKVYIIEIGNFIYDSINLAIKKGFLNIQLWLGIAKAVKIAQGFKNTHNRFGSIDFNIVQKWVDIDISRCVTIKLVEELLKDKREKFHYMIKQKAQEQLNRWFNKSIKIFIK